MTSGYGPDVTWSTDVEYAMTSLQSTVLSTSQYTTMYNNTNIPLIHNHYYRTVVLLLLVAFIVIAVLCNLFMCVLVKFDQRLHHMTYYFCTSMAVLHMAVSTTVLPISLAVFVADEFNYSDTYCKLWVTMDLFYCNNSCLHLAFANMDTYLRLKDPLRHGRIITWCSFVMWTGASWVISFVQGIAQFMLSQADSQMIPPGVCFIGDKNFLILGTIFSFIIPNIISVGFYCLCYKEIKAIKLGRYFDENGIVRQQYQYGSENSVTDEEECSDGSHESDKCEGQSAEIYPLSVVNNTNHTVVNSSNSNIPNQQQLNVTSFNDESELDDTEKGTSIQGHLNIAFSEEHNTSDSCTLMLRDTRANGRITPRVDFNDLDRTESIHECPDECLRHEIVLNRLMLALLIVIITFWAPLSFGNFTLGLCSSCQAKLATETLCILKWIAYSATWVAPMLYIRFSSYIRSAGYKLCTCNVCQ